MEYRNSEYFNTEDVFLFLNPFGRVFESKVEFSRGHWWTVEPLYYKATTVKCKLKSD